jgi:hypothetical protein
VGEGWQNSGFFMAKLRRKEGQKRVALEPDRTPGYPRLVVLPKSGAHYIKTYLKHFMVSSEDCFNFILAMATTESHYVSHYMGLKSAK